MLDRFRNSFLYFFKRIISKGRLRRAFLWRVIRYLIAGLGILRRDGFCFIVFL